MLNENGHYIEKTNDIMSQLTFYPKQSIQLAEKKPVRAYFETNVSQYIYAPRFFIHQSETDWRALNKISFQFLGNLRDYQKHVVEKCLQEMKKNASCILSIGTGAGKTCMALYLVAKLGLKTLIVVNKKILLDQWKDRIQQFLGETDIGILQGSIIQFKKITIAMLQTISKKKIDCDHSFVIIDECHNIATSCFSKAFQSIGAKYQLGLSATPKRNDGMDVILKLFLGEILYFENTIKQTQKKEFEWVQYENNCRLHTLRNGEIHFSKMLSCFAMDEKRNQLLLKKIIEMHEKKLSIIVLSDRIQQLEYLNQNLKPLTCIFAGKNKHIDTTKIILSTYAMMAEGVDLPHYNALVFATPRSNIIQAIGRIGRNGNNCFIFDIVDTFDYTFRQFQKRRNQYKKSGYCRFDN